jgi:hypothetical protein
MYDRVGKLYLSLLGVLMEEIKNIYIRLYVRSILSVLLQGCIQTFFAFVCRELKADTKVVVTDAETAPDSLTRVTVRDST